MEEKVLQLLNELKETQGEIKADIKKIDNRIDDIEREVNNIELVTSKNWMDVIELKRSKMKIYASDDLTQMKSDMSKLNCIVRQNCFDIAQLTARMLILEGDNK